MGGAKMVYLLVKVWKCDKEGRGTPVDWVLGLWRKRAHCTRMGFLQKQHGANLSELARDR